ncbi:MAG TPA: DUF4058 family protein [Tepidisphaeraceae bacterium]|nr:DUF4058 family protein [Tepidisphaeraceae bacterium]
MPIEEMPACDYYAMVARPEELPEVGIWPMHLRAALPEIAIPLREPGHNVKLNLRELFGQIYDAAGYLDYIYRALPDPPLSDPDMDWARQLLPA